MQIDGYAAKNGLKGLPRAELPSLSQTFLEGWHYLFVFALLVYMLLVLQRESLAPFYATALLLVINQFSRRYRLDWQRLRTLLEGVGGALSELAALLAGVGLIIGALSVTGLAGTLANDLVYLAGNNIYVLLVMGAITSFIFGMGMTITACYIFLAIVLAPPVALAAFVAAGIAKAPPMQVGLQSVRLGAAMYFVPFFFVLNPALILRGTPWEIVVVVGTAVAGIALIASALEGYVVGIGTIARGVIGWAARLLLFAGGLAMAMPGGGELGLSHVQLSLGGLLLAAAGAALAWVTRRR